MRSQVVAARVVYVSVAGSQCTATMSVSVPAYVHTQDLSQGIYSFGCKYFDFILLYKAVSFFV